MHNLEDLPLDLFAFSQPVVLAYIAAPILFILACSGLSRHESAVKGNIAGMAGMAFACAVAIVLVLVGEPAHGVPVTAVLIALAIGPGGAIGIYRALHAEMTGMPQLIAIFNGLVGLVIALAGHNSYLYPDASSASLGSFHYSKVFLSMFVGVATFTGSIVAGLKLQGRIPGRPILLLVHNQLNLVALIVCLASAVLFVKHGDFSFATWACLILMMAIALTLGTHPVIAIGGGDMPAVVPIVNSYSGWASAFTGLFTDNDLFIITGATVGSSGACLSYLMCEVMNRSFLSVLLGGFGADVSMAHVHGGEGEGETYEADTSTVADLLLGSKRMVIMPGYGMAVAQAQYPVAALVGDLEARGTTVTFGIHPVAGCLPGHTNVLLTEAKVPYDIAPEMDEVNDDLGEVDVVLVIEVSDTVDPAAGEPGSLIAGMPVLKVWDARCVIVFKRSMVTGYAGVQNPFFFRESTSMLSGDAKDSVGAIDRVVETVAPLRGWEVPFLPLRLFSGRDAPTVRLRGPCGVGWTLGPHSLLSLQGLLEGSRSRG